MKSSRLFLFFISVCLTLLFSGCPCDPSDPNDDCYVPPVPPPRPVDTNCANVTPAISPPTSFFAKAVSLSQVQLTGNQVSNAIQYIIYKNGAELNRTQSLNYNDNFTLTPQQ